MDELVVEMNDLEGMVYASVMKNDLEKNVGDLVDCQEEVGDGGAKEESVDECLEVGLMIEEKWKVK